MKVADSVMAGKASDSSIKWQLCYDMSARTWWMVSWRDNTFFSSRKFFFPFWTPPSLLQCTCYEVHIRAKTSKCKCSASAEHHSMLDKVSPSIVMGHGILLEICSRLKGLALFYWLKQTNKQTRSPRKCEILLCAQPAWVWQYRPSSSPGKRKESSNVTLFLANCSWVGPKTEQSAYLFCFSGIIIQKAHCIMLRAAS